MNSIQASIFPNRTVDDFIKDIDKLTQEIQDLYCADHIPWIIGVSWGKDSTAVLQLVWNAIAKLPIEKRQKTIYVITTDTLVENPIVSVWVRKCINKISIAANEKQMPFRPQLLHPMVNASFWVCLMGKGYPAPRHGFRWCTDRMKIQPVNYFIRNAVRANGETILVLGTRKAESAKRAATMKKHEAGRLRERLSPNSRLPNSLVYSPIEDWRTDEVWMYLMQWENPWGNDNKDLFNLYRGATEDNECPLVVDTSTPSCGDSRLGCWVCTMVSKDKSMEAMIQNDKEKEWLQPLLDLRNDLDEPNDRYRRDFRRLHGKVELFGSEKVEPIPGPYVRQWREYWLRSVLEAQMSIRQNAPDEYKDVVLITQEELSEIRRIWVEDKHEFDDSLPKIYREVMGEPFKDPRPGADDQKLLGSDEWDILAELCQEDTMHLELMSKLLDTERDHYVKVRRVGLYKDLEKCFETSSLSKEEAIAQAHLKRNVKQAASRGDVAAMKKYLAGETVESPPEEKTEAETLPLLTLEENNEQTQEKSWGTIKFKKGKSSAEKE